MGVVAGDTKSAPRDKSLPSFFHFTNAISEGVMKSFRVVFSFVLVTLRCCFLLSASAVSSSLLTSLFSAEDASSLLLALFRGGEDDDDREVITSISF